MSDDGIIDGPAASLGELDLEDLAVRDPRAAREIERLRDLMDRGDETRDDFLRLCELVDDAGAHAAAEYLLRRNLAFYDGGELYARRFGTTKVDEFHAAVRDFEAQLGAPLAAVGENDFLDETFQSIGSLPRGDGLGVLAAPFRVRICYSEPDVIEALAEALPQAGAAGTDETPMLALAYRAGRWGLAELARE